MTADFTRLCQHVADARTDGRKLIICGQGSKRHWLSAASDMPADLEMLSVTDFSGIVDYQPEELVITALAGTPVKEVEQHLAQHNQQLAFEAPRFFGGGTIGGMLGSGLSGPARPWSGSVRDAVLGIEMINGLGEHLNFGGQVMKNVAGYDVSRLLTGSFGTLGVIVAASLRVQPLPEHTVTLRFNLDVNQGIALCRELALEYLPITGTWWLNNELFIRLAGSSEAVDGAVQRLGGETASIGALWQEVRDHSAAFFQPAGLDSGTRAGKKLCRVVLPPASPQTIAASDDNTGAVGEVAVAAEDIAVEWAGGLRWIWHEQPATLRMQVHEQGGWMWVLAAADGLAAELPSAQQQLMSAIKHAFDPAGVFYSPLAGTLADVSPSGGEVVDAD